MTSETLLGELSVTDLMTVPSPVREEGNVLACVLLELNKCEEYVPYIVLEGKKRGCIYNSPPSMSVRRVPNGYRLPPIPLPLFNYGELAGNPKFLLETGRRNSETRTSGYQEPLSEGRQLSLL